MRSKRAIWAAAIIAAIIAAALFTTSQGGWYLIIRDAHSGAEYGRWPVEPGEQIGLGFIHSVNLYPLLDVFTVGEDGILYAETTIYYQFGAGVQTELNQGETFSVGEDGATHQCIEDLAIMRAIPNMTVLCPCDGHEMRQAVQALLAYDGPAYMRLGRLAVETVTDQIPDYRFEIGKGVLLREGSDVTVVAVGMMVQMALQAAEQLEQEGISVRVIDMHTIKPLDTEILLTAARETGCIVTTEEANVLGGLGSAVAEYLSTTCPVPVIRHGVEDVFGRSGAAQQVLEAYGLTAAGIVDKINEAFAIKNALTEP